MLNLFIAVILFLYSLQEASSFGAVKTTMSVAFHKRYTQRMNMSLKDPPIELCDENAALVIEEIKTELCTIFGYDPKSREVGITGS